MTGSVRKVFRSAQASRDMLQIWRHIAKDNPIAADKVLKHLQQRYIILADHPYAGESCHELLPQMRALTAGSYRIFYRVSPERVEILRILHTARNLSAIFES